MQGIVKQFPGVLALDQVSFEIHPGEVLALIGENGAGKSTLMKILGGVHQPNAGQITIEGQNVKIESVADANHFGIGFVHQELNVLDNINVAGNIFLGREPVGYGPLKLLNKKKLYQQTQPYLDKIGLDVKPNAQMSRLSIGQQQLVEISKALSMNARIIIMDEPTSSLTLKETTRLLEVIAELKEQGIAIIYISHRLGEIEQCADRVVALRDGKNAGSLKKEEIEHDAMVSLMVGRELKQFDEVNTSEKKEAYFQVKDLVTSAWPNTKLNFEVAGGEILGFAGLVGAGRSEMAQCIFGVDPSYGGEIRLDGKKVPFKSTKKVIDHGIYLVPEDRKCTGLILEMSIRQNMSLASMEKCSSLQLIKGKTEKKLTEQQIESLKIKTHSTEVAAGTLSGGNQQKIVLGKWLSKEPKVMIFDEPTRGIDVGAKSEIYKLMHELAKKGVAILMISSDMEEVLGVSDRIAVMYQGKITGILEKEQFSEENVMQLAVGKEDKATAP